MLDFLNKSETVNLPGSGDFIPSGIIASWMGRVMYVVMNQANGETDNTAGFQMTRKAGDYTRYYFTDKAKADEFNKGLGGEYGAQETWVFTANRSNVLNVKPENLEKFSDPLMFEVRVVGLRSAKYRHELHLISLPAAVHAMAVAYGYQVPDLDYGKLLSQDTLFTDDFQAQMIGSGDAKKADDANHYTKSLLWQQRAALWNALGEPDPSRYTVGANPKTDTASEKLANCLGVILNKWNTPVWARLVSVSDPRVDAKNKSDEQLKVPCLWTLFESEQLAKDAAKEDLARMTKNGDSPSNGNGHSLTIPDAWKDIPDDWQAQVETLKAQYSGKPRPIVLNQLRARETELAAKAEEVLAWIA